MNRPRPSDLANGQPIVGDLLAVMDETTPRMGAGVYYALGVAMIMEPDGISESLASFFDDVPGRKRPFHWHKEGFSAKAKMVDLLIDHGVVGLVRYRSVGRGKQRSARQDLLRAIVPELAYEGVTHLVAESVDRVTNSRDNATHLGYFKAKGGVPYVYDWRSKKERLLWVADAICGVTNSYFQPGEEIWHKRLVDEGVLSGEPEYG